MSAPADIFSRLAAKVCREVYPVYVKILENQLTPDEAGILVGIADKKIQAELAASLNIDQETLSSKIDDLKKRRFIVTRLGVMSIPRTPTFPVTGGM